MQTATDEFSFILKPTEHGVGVFATHAIKRGTHLRPLGACLAHDAEKITESGFTMHFVTDEYDCGPVFAEVPVPLRRGMTADEIGKAVNAAEHAWQAKLTDMIVRGEISWDGKNPDSLRVARHLRKMLGMI